MFGMNRRNRRNRHADGGYNASSNAIAIVDSDTRTGSTNVPLIELAEGSSGMIVELVGGCGACSRLMGLGLHHGSQIKVVRKNGCGPVLVDVGNTRVGLGRGICNHIIVDASSFDLENETIDEKRNLNHIEILSTCECLDKGTDN